MWVRFVVRRALIMGVIPMAAGVVVATFAGPIGLFMTWGLLLLFWVPSTLAQIKVMIAESPPADPRAIELADGRVLSRRDLMLYQGAKAWESITLSLSLPLLTMGFWYFSPAFTVILALLLAVLPLVVIRTQRIALLAVHGLVLLASDRTEEAVAVLRPITNVTYVAPPLRKLIRHVLARALARQGHTDEALELLEAIQPNANASVLAAQLVLPRGDYEPARALLLQGPLPPGFGGELARAYLESLLYLHTGEYEALTTAARLRGPLLRGVSLRTARFLDLMHAVALHQQERTSDAMQVLGRRDAHTEEWPWLEGLYPRIAAFVQELPKP